MKKNEVQIAIDWVQAEGWNPGLEDADCFYQADPNGFFIGLLDDEPVAVGSAVAYSEQFAFCGLYIVKKEFRGRGYGLQLTEERLKYVGNRITGIDGVVENVSKYRRIGYVPFYKQIRYELVERMPFSISHCIVELKEIPIQLLEECDRKYFQAPRKDFLLAWIHQKKSFSLGYLEDNGLRGYGVIRKCVQGYKIGPLFAETPSIARALFEALCLNADERPIYLDIPEPNKHALLMVNNYQMKPKFEVVRMYRNGNPSQPLDEIYGITTFELG